MSEISSYYTISNVSKKLKVPTHVLRFWEKKFNFIKPKKNQTGRRYYSNQDIVNLEIIKDLLHNKGYTIAGAIKHMKNNDQLDYKNEIDHLNVSNESLVKKATYSSGSITMTEILSTASYLGANIRIESYQDERTNSFTITGEDADGNTLTETISGTNGYIDISPTFYAPTSFRVCTNDGSTAEYPNEYVGHGLREQALELEKCVKNNTIESSIFPHSEILEVMELMDEIRSIIGLEF